MKHYTKSFERILTFFAILLLLSCTACGSADCVYSDKAEAWIDANQNGVWDNEEKPLVGVQFFVDDIRNNFQDVGDEAISDENGKAQLLVWLPGCPNVKFEISAKSPEGFQATTPDRIPVSKDAFRNSQEDLFSFGFMSLSE
jgi:hypothetical protein